jgi:hypothetical protein
MCMLCGDDDDDFRGVYYEQLRQLQN